MKDIILNAFKNLGFEMDELEDIGYGFDYEGFHYLLMYNNHDDENFLSIAVPAVFEKPESDEMEFYQVMDKINSTLKYIKVSEVGNHMWLFYEREIVDSEDFEKLLPKMIIRLEHAVRFIRNEDHSSASGTDNHSGVDIIGDIDVLGDND